MTPRSEIIHLGPILICESSPKKVAAKLLIFQGGAKPLSSVPVWAEPSQSLIGMWEFPPDANQATFR
jgi:hypothetical protein